MSYRGPRFAPRLLNFDQSHTANICWINAVMQQLYANPDMRLVFSNMTERDSVLISTSTPTCHPLVNTFSYAMDAMATNVRKANASLRTDDPMSLSDFVKFIQEFWVSGGESLFTENDPHDITEFIDHFLGSIDEIARTPDLSFIRKSYRMEAFQFRTCMKCKETIKSSYHVRSLNMLCVLSPIFILNLLLYSLVFSSIYMFVFIYFF